MTYTIIPDIHTDLIRLEASLALAKDSLPVFLGDFKGEERREVRLAW